MYNSFMPEIIQTNPKILGGMPIIKGTRIPISRIFALIGMGYKLKDIKKELPHLSNLTKNQLKEIWSYYQRNFI